MVDDVSFTNVLLDEHGEWFSKLYLDFEGACARQRFETTYKLGPIIGRGGFGIVHSGYRLKDGLGVAIKKIFKTNILNWIQIMGHAVPLEVCLLRKVAHINGVITIIDYCESDDLCIIIMERLEHVKDLFDYITENRTLNEQTAQKFFHQIVKAVNSCHEASVVHLDIKDENILVDVNSGNLKLIDFGAGKILRETMYTNFEGTHVYAPPEWIRIRKYYASGATTWSLGILLYNMITGNIPFQTDREILRAEVGFQNFITLDCQDLIRSCLKVCPRDRPTLVEILNHPWMKTSSVSTN